MNGFVWLGLFNNIFFGNNFDVEIDIIDEYFGRRGGMIMRGSMVFGIWVSYKYIYVVFFLYKLWMREMFIKNYVFIGYCCSG